MHTHLPFSAHRASYSTSFQFFPVSHTRWAASLLPFLLVALFLVAPATGQSFTGLGVPTLPGGASPEAVFPYGVSEDGTAVAGTVRYPMGNTFVYEAFRWEDGLFTLLGDLPGAQQVGSQGQDISGDGSLVVGWGYWHFTPPASAGFVHDGVNIAEVGGTKEIRAISENGAVMVGRSVIKEYPVGEDTETGYEAVRVVGGTVQGLGHLPWVNPDPVVFEPEFESTAHGVSADGSIVVGESSVTIAVQEAFIWQNGSMVGLGWLPAEFPESKAYDVSNDGSVVVGISEAPGIGTTAVRWVNQQIQTLSQFGQRSWAWAVSGDGTIIVGDVWSGGAPIDLGSIVIANSNAFIWTEDGGARLLKDVFENDYGLNLTGWQQLLSARDISDDGSVVVGWGINSEGQLEGWRAELSPLERALIVNRTGDEADHDLEDDACDTTPVEVGNQCTLRAAIQTANAREGIDGIVFEIEGAGVHTIALSEALPTLTEPLVLDATTQPGYAGTPLIQLTGTGEVGLDLGVGETRVRGLAIGGFSVAGIRITGPGGNVVEASYLGVGADGTSALPNGIGLLIEDSPENVIGRKPEDDEGTQAERLRVAKNEDEIDPGNVISGNAGAGLILRGSAASGNVVAGNHIGTTAAGDAALPNGAEGVRVEGAVQTLVGGSDPEARNLISGNEGAGVFVVGEAALDNQVAGNFIGTNAAGSEPLPNGTEGVLVEAAPRTLIGGEVPEMRNVIAGNAASGVLLRGPTASGSRVQGNYIGTTADGASALGNGSQAPLGSNDPDSDDGVRVEGVPDVAIGGTTETPGAAPGNVIAANAGRGVFAQDAGPEAQPDGLKVLGNLIGLEASGSDALPNGGGGIVLSGAVHNAIVGRLGAGNVIALGEEGAGTAIRLIVPASDRSPSGAHIAANRIGVNRQGTARVGILPESGVFVALTQSVEDGVAGLRIGGAAGEGNQIVATTAIFLQGAGTRGAVIADNTIGLFANGTVALQEDEKDVGVLVPAIDELVIERNVIGGQIVGVLLASNESTVAENRIGTNLAGSAARPNVIGVWIPSRLEFGGTQQLGNRNTLTQNLISGNEVSGLRIGGVFTISTGASSVAEGHPRGPDRFAAGSPKRLVGQFLSLPLPAASRAIEHGTLPAKEAAPKAENTGGSENVILSNRIGTNAGGIRQIGNGRASTIDETGTGVEVIDGLGNAFLGNLISGNGIGLAVFPDTEFFGAPQATVLGANVIGGSLGTAISGVPNQHGGVLLSGVNDNVLTALPLEEGSAPIGNLITENDGFGVRVVTDDEGGTGNQVRMSSFTGNKGPALQLVDPQGAYPSVLPKPPSLLSATVGETSVNARVSPSVSGTADLFFSDECAEGREDGTYLASGEVAAGAASSVEVGLALLGGITPEDAVGLYLSATNTAGGDGGSTSGFAPCVRIAEEDETVEADIGENFLDEIVEGLGISVEGTADGTTGGTASKGDLAQQQNRILYLTRHRLPPDNNTFEGSARTPSGAPIEPDTLVTNLYWTLAAEGLTDVTYKVCLALPDPSPDPPSDRLLVLHRRTVGAPWTSFDSMLQERDGALHLCAEGLSEFGDLALGFNNAGEAIPVELVGFEATLDGEGTVLLSWLTASETNNAGFHIERRVGAGGPFRQIGFVEGAGTTSAPQGYRYVDTAVPFEARALTYRLMQIDFDGAFEYSPEVEVALTTPERFQLEPVYPNPSRGQATLRYALPQAGPVRLALYDVLGRQVAVLVDEERSAGRHEISFNTRGLSSGLYLARLTGAGQAQLQRLTVIR